MNKSLITVRSFIEMLADSGHSAYQYPSELEAIGSILVKRCKDGKSLTDGIMDQHIYITDENKRINERDNQFAGFAHLVLMELVDNHSMALDWDKSFLEIEQIIARRAYDLVKHTLSYVAKQMGADSDVRFVPKDDASLIPDMTEWLKEGDK